MLRLSARAAARSAARCGSASGSSALVSVASARQADRHRQAPAAPALGRQAGVRLASSSARASAPDAAAAASASAPKAASAEGPTALFNERIKTGQLVEDEYQRAIVAGPLEKMFRELQSYTREVKELPKEPAPGGWISRLFGAKPVPLADGPGLTIPDRIPKGLYLFGDVGCGKSMLMDLFYESLPQSKAKRRIHFHQFMIDAHKRMHAFKLLTHKPSGMVMSAATAATAVVAKKVAGDSAAAPLLDEVDPIPTVARELAQEYEVLCFDEFQVTDIADAMILRRLLEHMLWHGVVFVMTSNRHPTDLYKNGIQRSSFLPCIALLQSQFAIVDLDSGVDYRKRPRALSKVYFSPLDEENLREMDKLWEGATSDPNDPPVEGRKLDIWGRKLEVPLSTRRAARFDFMQLCGSPKSAADYIEVCRAFGTLFIDKIPRMGIHQRDLARRFITLVDACYESKTKVFMSSEVPILQIFSSDEPASIDQIRGLMDDLGLTMDDIGGSPIFTGDEELFAFARVISRLAEMNGAGWSQIAREGEDAEAPPEY